MFALCLRIDDYATDTSLIAADLSMASTKYALHPATTTLTNITPPELTLCSKHSVRHFPLM